MNCDVRSVYFYDLSHHHHIYNSMHYVHTDRHTYLHSTIDLFHLNLIPDELEEIGEIPSLKIHLAGSLEFTDEALASEHP